MKALKWFIVLNLVVNLMIGCKTENTPNPSSTNSPTNQTQPPHDCAPTYYFDIDTFLIQNFLFNTGSYWFYYDSLNNTYDTCNMIQPEKSVFTYYEGSPGDVCQYNWRFAFNSTNNMKLQYQYFLQSNNMRIEAPLLAPFGGMNGINLCSTNNGTIVVDSNTTFYPNYFVDTVSYSNVYRFRFQGNGIPSTPDSGYYYLKYKVGIIKSELYFSGQKSTYKLIRYHIQ
jgi:hypothetical protein